MMTSLLHSVIKTIILFLIQSVCKTPVAVVKGQPSLPRDKSKEKASRYIRTIVRAFEDSPDIRKEFTTALKNYKEAV